MLWQPADEAGRFESFSWKQELYNVTLADRCGGALRWAFK
jgi:hypothetical protein